ncbi:GNAT family N-acetyltransferase [Anaerobacillus sp. 1_MG-2023]|uniref:GNAT family N-acetyltransferase n=1 Tax=Anaerobacillus sp. 1_MG-2023 TaxID=3062655 RepID=UPI0026E4719D|nr:GNAT family N-acetyltransferase [Anaerobacillus sp. 1_MG-2023]MDO6657812.1 GNAT family N-acetyltransferase [Anaerobacillus sp. 1_MG-2023]
MSGVIIKPLHTRDVEAVRSLLQSGIRKEIFPLTIYSSKKYGRFISSRLHQSEVVFVGAYQNKHLIGYAEWRILKDTLFLNNIYVSFAQRGLGIGAKLLQYGVTEFLNDSTRFFSLDVFEDNNNAMLWYKRLGLEKVGTAYWNVGKQKKTLRSRKECIGKISNWTEAENHQNQYGFSMLHIQTSTGDYRIGRISNTHYRIHQEEAFKDRELLLALYENDRQREILFISQNPFVDDFETVCISNRLTTHLSIQMGGLNGYQNLRS